MNAEMPIGRSLKRYLKFLILFLLFLKFHNINSLAQSDALPHPEKNPESGLMLTGDWVPESTHEIDFFSLPVIPSEHTFVNDVRYAVGRKVNQHNYLVFDNAMNNFPPKMLPDGNWLMTRRDKNRDVYMLVGGRHVDYPHVQ